MRDDTRLRDARRNFARQMLVVADASGNVALENAFATVPREDFLGDGRWSIMTDAQRYVDVSLRDPVLIYQDVVVGLQRERGVNNGSPSMHARFLHALAPKRGERVAHIGSGSGYYTALLAQLVGPDALVTAVEYDGELARRAAGNLAHLPAVTVVNGDGAAWPEDPVDIIYVNFAVTRPAEGWLSRLRTGGRLLFPLGPAEEDPALGGVRLATRAIALIVTRTAKGYAARALLKQVAFVGAEGAVGGSAGERRELRASLERGKAEDIRSLVWNERKPAERCWYAASDWALSYDEPDDDPVAPSQVPGPTGNVCS
jgi:protein-L-isoaspartate(D-aspartate) O-methyltransferase